MHQSPTIALARLHGRTDDGTLHIIRIPTTSGTMTLCNLHGWVLITRAERGDVFCGECWDAHLQLSRGVDTYEMGALMAVAADTIEESEQAAVDYQRYLASEHWQHMRTLAQEHYGGSCCLCGNKDELQVHHRTYARIGKERLSDLIVLCRKCHARHHGKAA